MRENAFPDYRRRSLVHRRTLMVSWLYGNVWRQMKVVTEKDKTQPEKKKRRTHRQQIFFKGNNNTFQLNCKRPCESCTTIWQFSCWKTTALVFPPHLCSLKGRKVGKINQHLGLETLKLKSIMLELWGWWLLRAKWGRASLQVITDCAAWCWRNKIPSPPTSN